MTLQNVLVPVGGAPLVTAAELGDLTDPADGAEVLLQAETAPNTLWRLRYNAGSAEPYGWEFVGGTPMYTIFNDQTAFDNTPADAWRNGDGGLPQLFVPRSGVYEISYGSYIGAPADGVTAKVGIGLDGADPTTINTAVNYNTRIASVASAHQMELSGSLRARMMYLRGNSPGNDMSVGRRWISIIPVRVL